MAANRSHSRQKTAYEYGNTARKLQYEAYEQQRPRKVSRSVERNRAKAKKMTPAYIVFLTVMMFITGYGCLSYLKLQSDITNDIKKIARLESQLHEKRAENDDTESRIKGSVDLEYIKKRAMEDLGMQYAREDQIVMYESDDTDYVRQFKDIR